MPTLRAVPLGQSADQPDFSWACASDGQARPFASLQGSTFGGSYAEARDWMATQAPRSSAFVVIFSKGEGMEAFLTGLPSEVASVPMAGGASARSASVGETFPSAQDVAIFAIQEGSWKAVSVTAHEPVGETFRCEGDDLRSFQSVKVDGKIRAAAGFFAELRAQHGLEEGDWDRVALVSDDGVVLHLHPEGDRVVGGTDLPASRLVRAAIFNQSAGSQAITRAATPGALAFGCAGLKGLFGGDAPWEDKVPTTYLYGELATVGARPAFANLTFAYLQRVS